MTLLKEEPGVWIVYCDTCQDRVELDTDPDDELTEAVADIKRLGWKVNPPENETWHTGHSGKFTRKVWTHTCKDCRT